MLLVQADEVNAVAAVNGAAPLLHAYIVISVIEGIQGWFVRHAKLETYFRVAHEVAVLLPVVTNRDCGQDDFATQLRGGLEHAGVQTQCVLSVNKPSGTAIILVTAEGRNSIVVIPGANHALRPEDLERHVDELRGAAVILTQLEIPMETVERLGELAASFGVPFVLDPAPAQPLAPALLRNVTWLTPNESETRSILASLKQPSETLLGDDAVVAAAEHLLATGVRNVVLKLGERGVYLAGKDVAPTYVTPYRVNAMDTTAAGDAFNGGFAHGLTTGMKPVDAARFACGVAAVSVTRSGAQPSMPTLDEVQALISSAAENPTQRLVSQSEAITFP